MGYAEMKRQIIDALSPYHPKRIGIFGSYSRGQDHNNSDLDVLVRFGEALSLIQLIRLENELSEKLGIQVDLITEGAIKNQRIRKSIEEELDVIYD